MPLWLLWLAVALLGPAPSCGLPAPAQRVAPRQPPPPALLPVPPARGPWRLRQRSLRPPAQGTSLAGPGGAEAEWGGGHPAGLREAGSAALQWAALLPLLGLCFGGVRWAAKRFGALPQAAKPLMMDMASVSALHEPPTPTPAAPDAAAAALAVLLDPRRRAIHKYVYLRFAQHHNPPLFYRLLWNHLEALLPLIYTPAVGEACEYYSNLSIVPHGLCLSLEDRGHILAKLQSWPRPNVKVVVVTDGERILGLGDLGWGGLGISEGKILLYTAAAGVPPAECLPLSLDVGTNNPRLLEDPEYRGLRRLRAQGAEYDDFVAEVVAALRAWQPQLLLQFEDFGNQNAFRLLHRYKEELCCFNDDIQGTAAVTLAGILAALRVSNTALDQQRILFYGAGEAGTGIGELVALALHRCHGLPLAEARKRCFFMDSQGLVCASRSGLQAHKVPFAHDIGPCADLLAAVDALQPTILIGVSTIPGAFTADVLRRMAALNAHPIVFPLSNPTSKSECTFQEAMDATGGTVIFASGSPFPPVLWDSALRLPAQANNAYIFPCVGHAAVLCGCRTIPDDLFLEAAYKLAGMQPLAQLKSGQLFPPFSSIRDVSAFLGGAVLQWMCEHGLGSVEEDVKDWTEYFRSKMWQPPAETKL